MKLKVEHFHVYDLVTVCFDYAGEILCTRYWEPVHLTLQGFLNRKNSICLCIEFKTVLLNGALKSLPMK